MNNDNSINNITRLVLQSMLWASRRITNLSNATTLTVYSTSIGPFSGINCKILIIGQENTDNNKFINTLNSLITTLGGSIGTYSGIYGIYINYMAMGSTDIISM